MVIVWKQGSLPLCDLLATFLYYVRVADLNDGFEADRKIIIRSDLVSNFGHGTPNRRCNIVF